MSVSREVASDGANRITVVRVAGAQRRRQRPAVMGLAGDGLLSSSLIWRLLCHLLPVPARKRVSNAFLKGPDYIHSVKGLAHRRVTYSLHEQWCSLCLCLSLFVCVFSLSFSFCPSVCLSVCLSHTSLLTLSPPLSLFLSTSVSQSFSLSVCLLVSLCLSVCLGLDVRQAQMDVMQDGGRGGG